METQRSECVFSINTLQDLILKSWHLGRQYFFKKIQCSIFVSGKTKVGICSKLGQHPPQIFHSEKPFTSVKVLHTLMGGDGSSLQLKDRNNHVYFFCKNKRRHFCLSLSNIKTCFLNVGCWLLTPSKPVIEK